MADLVEKVVLEVQVKGKEQIDAAAAAGEKLVTVEEKITRAKRTTLDGLERMMASYDKQTRLTHQYSEALQRLQRYERDSIGTAERRKEVYDKVTESFNRQFAALDGTAQRLEQLRAKFDPATTSAIKMTRALAELNEARQKGVNIAGGYEAAERAIIEAHDEGAQAEKALAAAAEQHLDAIDPLRVALRQYEAAEKSVTAAEKAGLLTTKEAIAARKHYDDVLNAPAVRKAKLEQEALTKTLDQYKNILNPTRQATMEYSAQMDQVRKLVSQGNLTVAEATKLQQHYADVLKNSIDGNNKLKTSQNQAADGSRNLNFQLTNLSFQLNDVVSGLASGQDAMRIFAQQGGQVFQIFQQGGKELVTGVTAALKNLISPINLARGGMIALGVAMALVIARAIQLDGDLRAFNTTLKGMGTDGMTTAGQLESVVTNLRRIGLSAKEARDAVQQVARTPGINPADAERLVTTGAGIGVTLGTGTTAGVQRLLDAINDSTPDSIIKLGVELRKLEPEEQKQILRLNQTEGAIKAIDKAYDLISKRMSTTYKDSIGALGQAWAQLSTTFDEFLKDAAVSKEVQMFLNDIKGVLKEIADILKLIQEIREKGLVPTVVNRITAAGDEATIRAQESAADLRRELAKRGGASTQAAEVAALRPEFATKWQEMVADATAKGIVIGIGSGSRTWQHQLDMHNAWLAGGKVGPVVAHPSRSMHVQAFAVDATGRSGRSIAEGSIEDQYLTANLARFNMHRPVPGEPWHIEPMGIGAVGADKGFAAATAARNAAAAAAPVPATTTSPQAPPPFAAASEAQRIAAEKALAVTKAMGQAELELQTRIEARAAGEAIGIKGTELDTFVTQAVTIAITKRNAELEKAIRIKDMEAAGEMKVLDAFKISEAAGYREIAMQEARIKVAQHMGNEQEEARVILEASALSALRAGAQQVAAALPQVAAQERLAQAAKGGAAAQHEAEVQAQIATRTQDALAKAEASRNPKIIAQAEALNKAAEAEIRRSNAAKASLANTEAIRAERQTQEQLQLQINLQGNTSEAIQTQVNLLRTKNELDAKGNDLTAEEKKLRLESVAATGLMNEKLAEAVRQQQRFDDMIRSAASAIENELKTAVEDAFSGKKVESWGEKIKKMLPGIAASITDALFIRPAIGSIAGLFSSNVGTSIGGFGNLFGGGGGQTLTGTVGGQPASFSLSNVSAGWSILGGLGKELGLSGSMTTSGGGIFTSGIFGPEGALSGVGGFVEGGAGGIFAHTPTAADFAAGVGPVQMAPGSLFGTTSLGTGLSAVGAGFGAGMLANSLAGGNTLGGTIGSGVGSLAGMALGSMIGMPFLGAILGGAGAGLLGGMFGNSRPSNASAGGNIDFATGKITGVFSGGNQQIDQATSQAIQSLGNVTSNILALSGGTLSGNLLLQNGVNTGFTADSTLPGYAGRFNLGKDATQAVNVASLAIAKSLTGVSDTMKNVLGQITDAAEIENAIKFAKVYNDLKTAFDNAFSSIAQDAKVIGPFSLALDQLKATFKDLTDNAIKFGLSLDPINAGLTEATKRLNQSFELFIQQQEVASTGQSEFLGPAFQAHQQYLQNINDANALGLGTPAMINRIVAIEQNTLRTIFADLTKEQLRIVVDAFKTLAPEVSAFAETMVGAALAAADAAVATDNLYASLIELRTQLTTGPSSGLTAQEQLIAANDNFAKTLALVQGGNTGQIGTLATQGSELIALSEQTYGNAPQTSTIRATILAGLNAILTAQGFASGTTRTPPGMILVGERGPELISQPGGLTVFNAADTMSMLSAPATNSELVAKLDTVIGLLAGGNAINRAHGAVSQQGFNRLSGQVDQMNQPAFEPPQRRTA